MFFRSLSLLATVACAGLTIAVPLGLGDLSNPLGNSVSGVSAPALPAIGAPALPPTPRDAAHPTLPEAFKAVVITINPIADKLKTAVSLTIKADINADVVVGLLHEIIAALTITVEQVQYIVDNPVGFVLTIDGVVVALDAVAAIICALLYVIFTTLAIVVGAVDATLCATVLPLVATIGGLVVHLLTLTVTLIPDVLVLVTANVSGLHEILIHLQLGGVIKLLGL